MRMVQMTKTDTRSGEGVEGSEFLSVPAGAYTGPIGLKISSV